jgi:hypothetical protein
MLSESLEGKKDEERMQQSLMRNRTAIELGVHMVLYGSWVALIQARVLRVPPHVALGPVPKVYRPRPRPKLKPF